MINTAQYINVAKDEMKRRFNVEIEVELIRNENVAQRKSELAKQYGKKTDGNLSGLFMPEANELPPIILVGYNDDDEFGLIDIFYHELQHAIDYYEAHANVEQEHLHYFTYYTEYNANFYGFLRSNVMMLSTVSMREERQKFIAGAKNHLKSVFDNSPKTFDDIFFGFLPRVAAFAEMEKSIDYSLLDGLPGAKFFEGLVNFINRYEPTREWYTGFKSRIDDFRAKNTDSQNTSI